MADRPAATFGFSAPWPLQMQRAIAWQRQSPRQRWLMVQDVALPPCVQTRSRNGPSAWPTAAHGGCCRPPPPPGAATDMGVRVISRDNGVGLSRDLQLIAQVLRDAGVHTQTVGFGGSQLGNRLHEAGLLARRAVARAGRHAAVRRTRVSTLPATGTPQPADAESGVVPAEVASHGCRVSSACCARPTTRRASSLRWVAGRPTPASPARIASTRQSRRDDAFFHLAGRSTAKGTEVLLATWRRHPEWPRLTVVQHPKVATPAAPCANIDHRIDYLDDAALQRLQNANRFHLCPSEAEGFGHYLMEAMGIGAVVLATDAAPMNELVTPQRGVLIPVARTRREGLVDHALVDQGGIEQAVERALALTTIERDRDGRGGAPLLPRQRSRVPAAPAGGVRALGARYATSGICRARTARAARGSASRPAHRGIHRATRRFSPNRPAACSGAANTPRTAAFGAFLPRPQTRRSAAASRHIRHRCARCRARCARPRWRRDVRPCPAARARRPAGNAGRRGTGVRPVSRAPAAMVERRAEEMRAPQQAPDVGLFDATGLEQRAQHGQRVGDPAIRPRRAATPTAGARGRSPHSSARLKPSQGLLLDACTGGRHATAAVASVEPESSTSTSLQIAARLVTNSGPTRSPSSAVITFTHRQRCGHQCRSRSRGGLRRRCRRAQGVALVGRLVLRGIAAGDGSTAALSAATPDDGVEARRSIRCRVDVQAEPWRDQSACVRTTRTARPHRCARRVEAAATN